MKALATVLTIIGITIYSVNFARAQVVNSVPPSVPASMHMERPLPMQVGNVQSIAPMDTAVAPMLSVNDDGRPADLPKLVKTVGTMVKVTWWVDLISKVILGLLGIVGIVLGALKGSEWRKALRTKRVEKIHEYTENLFPLVEEIAKVTEWKGDDKLVELLKRIDKWLFVGGDAPMSDHEVDLVKDKVADLALADKAFLASADEAFRRSYESLKDEEKDNDKSEGQTEK